MPCCLLNPSHDALRGRATTLFDTSVSLAFGKRNKLTAQLRGHIAKDALHIAHEKHGCQVLNLRIFRGSAREAQWGHATAASRLAWHPFGPVLGLGAAVEQEQAESE